MVEFQLLSFTLNTKASKNSDEAVWYLQKDIFYEDKFKRLRKPRVHCFFQFIIVLNFYLQVSTQIWL